MRTREGNACKSPVLSGSLSSPQASTVLVYNLRMLRTLRVVLFLLVACLAWAADTDLAGAYSGPWSGSGGGSGDIRLKFEQVDDKWKAEASFTLGGEEVKCLVKSLKVDGAKVQLQYEFELQGNKLKSNITGQLSGRTLEGKYETSTVPDGGPVDSGTWKATAK